MNNQQTSINGKSAKDSAKISTPQTRAKHRIIPTTQVKFARVDNAKTILGVKIPAALSFSHLTRFLSSKDESLDQPPAPLPAFPTVQEAPPSAEDEQAIDTATIEDERSMLLLSEAERFAEFSENRTLSEIARGSLNRTADISKAVKYGTASRFSQSMLVILALCFGILITCGYFVVSYLMDEMRFKNTSPKFGSRF